MEKQPEILSHEQFMKQQAESIKSLMEFSKKRAEELAAMTPEEREKEYRKYRV